MTVALPEPLTVESTFTLPPPIAAANAEAVAERNRRRLWELPTRDGIAEHDQLKHRFPFVGTVTGRVDDISFQLFSVNDDVVAWRYFWLGDYETEVMAAFASLARGARRVLDVGAYTGCYALVAALGGARVDAFEMVPRTVERLKINVHLNNVRGRVTIHPVGVSDRAGSVSIHMPRVADFLGTGNSVNPKERVESVDSTVCSVLPLDRWWHDAGRPHIDLIKLDVEEHEVEALDGAAELLAACRPPLVIEIEGRNRDAIADRADRLGYSIEQLYGLNHLMLPADPP